MAKSTNPFRYVDSSPEVIRRVVMMYNLDRHLISRETYKAQRSAALASWNTLAAQALHPPPCLRSVETRWRWTDSTAISLRGSPLSGHGAR